MLYTTGQSVTDGMKAMYVEGGVMLLKPYRAPELARTIKQLIG